MNVSPILTKTIGMLRQYSPAILTGVGVAGVVTTAVLAGRATPKAISLMEEYKAEKAQVEEIDISKVSVKPLEVVQVVWREYVPTFIFGALTIASIISAQSISTQRNVALLGAYSLTEKAFDEYKSATKEIVTPHQEDKIQSVAAQKRMDSDPLVSDSQVIITGGGEHMCYDSLTGRYFKSDMETIRKAQNDINELVHDAGYASQNEFYDRLNLEPTTLGHQLGWTTGHLMDLVFSPILDAQGRPCVSIGYRDLPLYHFDRLGY